MKRFSFSILIVLLLFSTGCSSAVKPPATQTAVPPYTELFTATPTLFVPSATSSPTQTQTPIPLPATLTPFPTLTTDEAKKVLFELLLNNGGCRLPCLLGYTPITSHREVQNFFSQFVVTETPDISISKVSVADGSSVGFFIHLLNTNLNIDISTYETGNRVEALSIGGLSQPKWAPKYAEVMKYYLLPQILTNYGEPSQVLIKTFRNDRQRPDVISWPFFLVLLYPDQGFYLKYEMERVSTGAEFLGCPSKSFVSVGVWPPKNDAIFNKMILVMTNGGDLRGYKSISDAIAMSLEEFYQTFKEPTNTQCIKTTIETWPNP
jgi:hypothetical protein